MRIEWTARTQGPEAGYDIKSFSEDGSEIFIEVKTTNGHLNTPFLIAELPELKSIGFPYGIGCGLAGGDWNKYGRLLEDFAERVGERGVSVILYRLGL